MNVLAAFANEFLTALKCIQCCTSVEALNEG